VPVMGVPEQIEDEEHEQRLERVAAIDVAKAFGKVCTRLPHESKVGKRVTLVWDVPATTNAVCELAAHLVEQRIERVVLESTSDYWRPFFYMLEAAGRCVWLVKASDVKQVSGRPKTDKLDAVWLAKLNERGMLRPSFVPPADIRRLRDHTRLRRDLTRDRTRHKQRTDKLLEDALIKLSTVATDIFGKSGRDMIEALITGQRDPKQLAELARGADAGQTRRPGPGPSRPLRRAPRRTGPHPARPGRRARHPDRAADHHHRRTDRGDAHRGTHRPHP
jgi:transposase